MVDASAVILAGGRNSRMQRNKAFLEVDRQPLIQDLIQRLNTEFPEIIVVSNEPECYAHLPTRVVTDRIPRQGPLSGIHAGLVEARYHHCFVVACDMPFVHAGLAAWLAGKAKGGYDVVVPRLGQHLQPLFAVYGKGCLPHIEQCLHNHIHKIIDFYSKVRVCYVDRSDIVAWADPDTVFYNINTPADLLQAKAMISTEGERHDAKDQG